VNALAWIEETGWEAVTDAVAGLGATTITLLHVIPEDVVEGPAGARAGLLGRHRGPRFEAELSRLSTEGAQALLDAAAQRLGAPAETVITTGRVEHEVVAAGASADVLVLARRSRDPGPHSLGHPSRFVVDHAACAVLVVWPT
jgi:nucleotide-binding universal stress UspA family protein